MKEMNKPLVTLIIFAYKAEQFIAETIDGALNQTYENLEIIISDDASSDNTSKVIQDVVGKYKGNKRVVVNINKQNMGIVPHMTKLFNMANGDIIATNPGDDISTPNRISDTVDYFCNDSNLQMVTFSRKDINEDNIEIGGNCVKEDKYFRLNDKYFNSPNIMFGGTAVAFRKNLLSLFGSLNEDAQTEDSTMRFRAILAGGVVYSHKIGLKYRIHGNNISIGIGKYRLKTELIAKQYKDDVNKAEQVGLISEKVGNALKLKIDNYVNERTLEQLIDQNTNSLNRLYLKVKKKINHILFKIRVIFVFR